MAWSSVSDQAASWVESTAQLNPDEYINDSNSWDLSTIDAYLGNPLTSWVYDGGLTINPLAISQTNQIYLSPDYFYADDGETYTMEVSVINYSSQSFGILEYAIGLDTGLNSTQLRNYPSSFVLTKTFDVVNTEATVALFESIGIYGNVVITLSSSGSLPTTLTIDRVSIYKGKITSVPGQSTSWSIPSVSTTWATASSNSTTWN